MVFILALFPRTPVNPPRLHTASTLPSKQLHLPPSPAIPVLQSKQVDPSATPLATPQLKQDEQASLWKAFSEARREVTALNKHEASLPFNQGVRLFAQNPGQKLTTRFLDDGVRIQSGRSNASWQATFSTTNLPPATSITTQGSRVEYLRGPVIEWYDNKPGGIEQGFIITHPISKDGETHIEIAVEGLAPTPSDPHTFTLSDSSGSPTLSYSKLSAWDADGRLLPARMESTSNGITLIVSHTGARYPIVIDPLITSLEQKLGPEVAGDGAGNDSFGASTSLSGDTALIGAYEDETAAGSYAGSAYVFTRSGSSWTQQAKLKASDGGFDHCFGKSVSLSGENALVGASASGINNEGGSAYIFTRTGTIWAEQAKLLADDGENYDSFGSSVSLSGETALIGAYADDNIAGSNAGSAYIFTRSGNSWTQQAKLIASDGAASDFFGYSVSLSNDTALVGAYRDNQSKGSAYVFTRSGTSWTQQAKLSAGDGAVNELFGYSVSLYNDTALVGSDADTTATAISMGSAYVFTRVGSSWSQQAKLTASDAADNDHFGISVCLSGENALIGASSDDTGKGTNAGSAYVFTRTGSVWTEQAKLTAENGTANRAFGISVSISGDTALAGASSDDLIGSAYIFTRSGNSWTQQAELNVGDGAANDFFGTSVALYGETALIGVSEDDTSNGINAGSAYVFTRSGTSWTQQAKLNASDGVNYDSFGSSVSLFGNTAVVGAPDHNGSAGSAYVFIRVGTSWTQQAKLSASDGAAFDFFGVSISLSGDTALIGTQAESAYVFTRSGSTWARQTKLTASDGAILDSFGLSVSLSGDTALVGAYTDDTVGGIHVGSAYVFTRSGITWSQQAKLNASDATDYDNFGISVCLSGDCALIGASSDDNGKGPNSGSAYVFQRNGSAWTEQAKLTATDGMANDLFGGSTSVSGNTVLVGASGDDNYKGSVYVFIRSGNSWIEHAKLSARDGSANDYFGNTLSLSGDTALVGASGDDGYKLSGESALDQGSVSVFRLWTTTNNDTDNDGASDIWEISHGFNSTNANDISTLDSDGDGDRDLLEIFQGTGRLIPTERHGLTNTVTVIDTTTRELKTRYRRSTTQTAVYGTLKWSTDLVNWHAPGVDMNGVRISVTESVVESGTDYEIREATASVALGSPDRLFLKLELIPVE